MLLFWLLQYLLYGTVLSVRFLFNLVDEDARSSPASVDQVLVVLAREPLRKHAVRQRRLCVWFAVTYHGCQASAR